MAIRGTWVTQPIARVGLAQSIGLVIVRRSVTTARRRKLVYLEAKVPFGIVRCGRCGWLIRKGSGWRVGGNGPEHELCEHEPCAGGPPGPRIWSQNWGATFDDD